MRVLGSDERREGTFIPAVVSPIQEREFFFTVIAILS
jgi:hypothetical protein